MKKTILIMGLIVALSAGISWSQTTISAVTGKVEVGSGEQWEPAATGTELAKADSVRTGTDGKAEITFSNGSRVWLKENTLVTVEELESQAILAQLKIDVGSIKAKVEPLKSGQEFKVKSPACVTSVRGTEFIVVAQETASQVLLLSGKVEIQNLVTNELTEMLEGHALVIHETGELELRELTPEEKQQLGEPWMAVIIEEESTEEAKAEEGEEEAKEEVGEEKEMVELKDEYQELRQELRRETRHMRNEIRVTREIVKEIRETDFSAGRTMKDVHGNVVRIDQRMMRPSPNKIQIINICKRPEGYVYNGKFPGSYTKSDTYRLDIAEAWLTFNQDLPASLFDWPKYIMDNNETMDIDEVGFRIAKKDGPELRMEAAKGPDDEMEAKFYICGVEAKPTQIENIESEGYSSWDGHQEIWVEPDPLYESTYEQLFDEDGHFHPQIGIDPDADPPTGEMWVAVTVPFDLASNEFHYTTVEGDKVYTDFDIGLNMEFYAINNDGNVLDITKLMNGDLGDPFSVMKVIGGECIISANDKIANSAGALINANLTGDVAKFKGDNIDIVMTPDLALAAIQQSLSALPSMMKDIEGDGGTTTSTE